MKIEVTLTKEQYEAFGNGKSITLLPPKKEYVIEYNDNLHSITPCNCAKNSSFPHSVPDADLVFYGLYRKIKENVEFSKKENRKRNLLEALVEDLQGVLGGDYVVYEAYGVYKTNESTYFNVGDIRMKEETAIKVCELLNSEQYSLEV